MILWMYGHGWSTQRTCVIAWNINGAVVAWQPIGIKIVHCWKDKNSLKANTYLTQKKNVIGNLAHLRKHLESYKYKYISFYQNQLCAKRSTHSTTWNVLRFTSTILVQNFSMTCGWNIHDNFQVLARRSSTNKNI